MPCIWGRHNRSQIFLEVAVLPADLVSNIFANPSAGESANISMFRALIDTGAQTTCITKHAADTVGLKPIGRVPVIGVSGQKYHNNYLFHVAFVRVTQQLDDPATVQGNMHIFNKPIQGAELEFQGRDFDVLLGMDVIGFGSLAVEGNGTFSFSF